jgi:hypothetical protein
VRGGSRTPRPVRGGSRAGRLREPRRPKPDPSAGVMAIGEDGEAVESDATSAPGLASDEA